MTPLERLAAVHLEGIPFELRRCARWGLWRMEDRDGEPTKVPYSVVAGDRASSTNLLDWTTFDLTAAFFLRKRKYDGLAFVLGDGWVGVDLDGCRDTETGDLHPKARAIIDRLGGYAEVSPSGTGVKVFIHGSLPPGRRKAEGVFGPGKHRGVEMYDSGRYFTVTGVALC